MNTSKKQKNKTKNQQQQQQQIKVVKRLDGLTGVPYVM